MDGQVDAQFKMACKKQNPQGDFEKLWRSVEKRLQGYFYRKGCSDHDCEDLVQETCLRAWDRFATLKGDFKSWVFGIAKFTLFAHIRSRKRMTNLNLKLAEECPADDPGTLIVNRVHMQACLRDMDSLDYDCLFLHDYEGFTLKEISEYMGISVSNAHLHVKRAHEFVRERFTGTGGDD
jgi:RNA polymerase sigma-70 factor, ECF subfamily